MITLFLFPPCVSLLLVQSTPINVVQSQLQWTMFWPALSVGLLACDTWKTTQSQSLTLNHYSLALNTFLELGTILWWFCTHLTGRNGIFPKESNTWKYMEIWRLFKINALNMIICHISKCFTPLEIYHFDQCYPAMFYDLGEAPYG